MERFPSTGVIRQVGYFRDSSSSVNKVISRYLAEVPAVGLEIANLCRELGGRGPEDPIDFTERGLRVLTEIVRGAVHGEKDALRDVRSTGSFMLRNRHVIGKVGAFLGCIIIENLGGRWRREDGGLVVGRVGGVNLEFDPFDAVIRAIIRPKQDSLESQYTLLKEEVEGRGPRVRFRDRVLAALSAGLKSAKVGRVSGFDVFLTNGTRVHLGNLYATCLRTPGCEAEAISNFVSAVLSQAAADGEMPAFGQACARLFPVLKTTAFLSRPLGSGTRLSDDLVWEGFHCELAVCFVYDTGDCARFVRAEDVRDWETSKDEVRWHALENLAASTALLEHGIAQTRFGKAVVVNANDGYDAARILLPGLRDALAPHLGESFLVAVPCRDLLVAFEDRKKLVALIKRQVCEDAHLGAYGLTDELFACDGGGVRPFGSRL
jgi:uncharacterized protein YtpQ (UPF0354 family)